MGDPEGPRSSATRDLDRGVGKRGDANMARNSDRIFLSGLLLLGTAMIISCSEDDPDECYQDSDCPGTQRCKTTQYLSGRPSGGSCVECLSDSDCTDPASPTCDKIFYTCRCAAPSGSCGPNEGGAEAGTEAGADGAPSPQPDGAAEPDDAG
jgi:hypothetical protein